MPSLAGLAEGQTATSAKQATSAPAAQAPANAQIPELPIVAKTAESLDKFTKLMEETDAAIKKSQIEEALKKVQEAYGLCLDMRYSEGQGQALTKMCEIYCNRGQLPKAKELGENAVEVLADVTDKKALAKARVQLAQVYFGLDNAEMGGEQLEYALKDFSNAGVTDAPETAKVMDLVGQLLVKMSKPKEALQFYEGAASYYAEANDRASEVATRLFITEFMQELGWFTAAKEEANKAITAATEAKDHGLLVESLAALGNCEYSLGEFWQARSTYDTAVSMPVKFSNPMVVASIRLGYGACLAAAGDYDNAKVTLEKALDTMKAKSPALAVANLDNILGCVEAQLGHTSAATERLNQALELQSVSHPKRERLNVTILRNQAAVAARSGDNHAAQASLISALDVLKKFDDDLLRGRVYADMAEVCLNLRDVQSADNYLKQAIAISEKIHDDSALWRDFTNSARIAVAQRQDAQVADALSSAVSFFRSPQAGYFASTESLDFVSPRASMAHQLVSLLVSQGQTKQALLVANQLKEESFIVEWNRRGGMVKPADRDIYEDLSNERAHLHIAETTSSPDKLLSQWQKWMARFEQLAAENRPLAALIAPVPVTADAIIAASQQSRATVLDYLVGTHNTIVFTIPAQGALAATILDVGHADLDEQVTRLLSESASSATSNKQLLRTLYDELIPDMIASLLPHNPERPVVIIPDGVLFNLPFAALMNADDQYFVQGHTLTLAPSVGMAFEGPKRSGQNGSVILAEGITDKSHANEMLSIASLFGADSVTTISGKESDVAALEREAKSKAFLHFTANLNFSANEPLYCLLPFNVGIEGKEIKAPVDSLFRLSLPSDLAIWSDTSISSKDTQGNAMRLFSRGLNYAGVRNVIVTLWQAPEPSRTDMVVDIYKGEKDGLTQAQSLRKAQLAALAKDPSYKSWAAFQLFGPGF
jgi:CHAT domain-containing protein/Tfp pilus assembly protein PilF